MQLDAVLLLDIFLCILFVSILCKHLKSPLMFVGRKHPQQPLAVLVVNDFDSKAIILHMVGELGGEAGGY